MPLLTELENVLGGDCYKDFAPNGAENRAPVAPGRAEAGVVFFSMKFFAGAKANSRNSKTHVCSVFGRGATPEISQLRSGWSMSHKKFVLKGRWK